MRIEQVQQLGAAMLQHTGLSHRVRVILEVDAQELRELCDDAFSYRSWDKTAVRPPDSAVFVITAFGEIEVREKPEEANMRHAP